MSTFLMIMSILFLISLFIGISVLGYAVLNFDSVIIQRKEVCPNCLTELK